MKSIDPQHACLLLVAMKLQLCCKIIGNGLQEEKCYVQLFWSGIRLDVKHVAHSTAAWRLVKVIFNNQQCHGANRSWCKVKQNMYKGTSSEQWIKWERKLIYPTTIPSHFSKSYSRMLYSWRMSWIHPAAWFDDTGHWLNLNGYWYINGLLFLKK